MKKAIALLMALVMIVGLVACGAKTETPAAAAPAAAAPASSGSDLPEVKWICAHGYPNTSDEQEYLMWIANKISEETGGKFTMTCIPDGQYGSEAEIEAQCVNNVIQCTLGEGSAWADVVNYPALGVFGLPYLYTSFAGLKGAGLTVVKGECERLFEENGIGLKAFEPFSGGLRGVWTIDKPVLHPEDLKNMKIRVPEIKLFVDTVAAMGANPTTIAWTEVYTALSQGVVEGLEIDPDTGYKNNLCEVTKYFVDTNHLGSLNIICANLDAWNALPKEYQDIFEAAVTEAASMQYDVREANVAQSLKAMEDAGMVISHMTPEEINVFVEAMKPVWDEYANEYGVGDIIEKLSAAGAA
jgi:TRAP-type C4-dicarboxylate transport system substrate-binding protein